MKQILFLILLFSSSHLRSQFTCVGCYPDSLLNGLERSKNENEKKLRLQAIIDYDLDHFSSPIATTPPGSQTYLQMLLDSDENNTINKRMAYESYLRFLRLYEARQFAACLISAKETVALFDRYHQPINGLLMQIRNVFNELGMQEEKLAYFTDKLHYYQQNEPHSNTAGCYYNLGGYYASRAVWNLSISSFLKSAEVLKPFDYRSYLTIMGIVAGAYYEWGNIEKSLQYLDEYVADAKHLKDWEQLAYAYRYYIKIYVQRKNYNKAILYADSMLHFGNDPELNAIALVEKAIAMIGAKHVAGALPVLETAKKTGDSAQLKIYTTRAFELDFGYYMYHLALGNNILAEQYLLTAYRKSKEVKNAQLQVKYLDELARFYDSHGQYEKSVKFTTVLEGLLYYIDSSNSPFKIAEYETKKKELQQLDNLNTLKQERAVQAATIRKNSLLLWGSLAAILLIGGSFFFVYRLYGINKKTLATLRSTQTQLIASEKLASLGELTAGIAHEIQNPLNFVNNFSELSIGLLTEMSGELDKADIHEAKEIAENVKENLNKVMHHGKRAEGIVRGMLEHSRSGGVKEATDINTLAEEYLRLAYHGLRAKNDSFNAAIQTNYDPSIGKVNVIPQDLGRVILNIATNAFYVVNEKKQQMPDTYQPAVTLTTKKLINTVLIEIRDNGNGISQSIVDKIFQPFFTTKPPGQGTGLGLSMSYDIVTKGHGGKLTVSSVQGEGSVFTIEIPA